MAKLYPFNHKTTPLFIFACLLGSHLIGASPFKDPIGSFSPLALDRAQARAILLERDFGISVRVQTAMTAPNPPEGGTQNEIYLLLTKGDGLLVLSIGEEIERKGQLTAADRENLLRIFAYHAGLRKFDAGLEHFLTYLENRLSGRIQQPTTYEFVPLLARVQKIVGWAIILILFYLLGAFFFQKKESFFSEAR